MTRGEARPPDRRPLGASVGASLGPERVAAILSVLVVAVVGTIAVGNANGGAAPSSSPGVTSTGPTVGPSSTAAVSSDPSAPATPAAWASAAATLIEIQGQIVAGRDQLATALAEPTTPTSRIARELRALNTALTTALRAVDTLRAEGAPGDLVDDLATTHQGALDAGVQTLQASLRNAPAYQTGGAQVVAALADLEDLTRRLRTEAGLP